MPKQTCFVIMSIGDQTHDGTTVSSGELKTRYTDLIREAILKAGPNLEVTRADEVAIPGTITNDILTRIMHSDIVVADVSYPNPNVFYELGLRHASKPGTIILRDTNGPRPPFDIAHLRHIAYENTASGLKKLSEAIAQYLAHFKANPDSPDNQFLEMAKLTQFQYPDFGGDEDVDPETAMITSLFQNPETFDLFVRKSQGEDVADADLARAMMSSPDIAIMLAKHMIDSGQSIMPTPDVAPPKKRAPSRSRTKKPAKTRSKRKPKK